MPDSHYTEQPKSVVVANNTSGSAFLPETHRLQGSQRTLLSNERGASRAVGSSTRKNAQ